MRALIRRVKENRRNGNMQLAAMLFVGILSYLWSMVKMILRVFKRVVCDALPGSPCDRSRAVDQKKEGQRRADLDMTGRMLGL